MVLFHTSPPGRKISLVPSKTSALLLIASAALAGQQATCSNSPALWLRCAVQARRAVVMLSSLGFSFWVDHRIDEADGLLLNACDALAECRSRGAEVVS